MTALLRIENLVKHFPISSRGRKAVVSAVNGISLEIRQGETLGLVGESGSGKTTVGRCVVRLEPPTAGTVYFQGKPISDLTPKAFRPYRSRIQIVFQEPHDSLNPRMRVGQTILEPIRLFLRDLSPASQLDRMKAVAHQVGLSEALLDAYPPQLSGGHAQRVAIGRAISSRPDLLVLDEPTSALDPPARAEIMHLLIQLQRSEGLTYLFISHDLATVRRISTRVAVMYLGKIVEQAPVETLFRNPLHPYSRALLSSYLAPDPNTRRNPLVLKGEIPSPIDLPRGCYLYSRCPLAAPQCQEAHPPLGNQGIPRGQGDPENQEGAHWVACYRIDAVGNLPGGGFDEPRAPWSVRANNPKEGSS